MEPTRGEARGRWGTAMALLLVVMSFSVFEVFSLVALPLAVLLVALPDGRHWKWVLAGAGIWVLAVALPHGPLGAISRGWALLLGSTFLVATLLRPGWGVLPRALTALGGALGVSALWLAATGQWEGVDWMMREHFRAVASLTTGDLGARMPDAPWVKELGAATQRMAGVQWQLFPAMLALQSLAALTLASWWIDRLRRQQGGGFRLRPLHEFRFNDQLVWVLIAGLVLVAVPLGAVATRAGYNALFFMAGLYALRGIGVFWFLVGGAPSFFGIVFGALAAIFLYPLVLTAVLLVGLGDTWLDVRRRATLAPRA